MNGWILDVIFECVLKVHSQVCCKNITLDNQIYYLYHLIFDHCKKSGPPQGDTFSISILGTWVECQLVIFETFDTMLKDKGKHNSDNANFVTDIDLGILEEKHKKDALMLIAN